MNLHATVTRGGVGLRYNPAMTTPNTSKAFSPEVNASRARVLGAKMLAGLPEQDPLKLRTLGELNQYLRYEIGARGRDGQWNTKGFQRFGLQASRILTVENLSPTGRVAIGSPLNLQYLFKLEPIAAYFFADHAVPPTDAQRHLQRHFWELAWDYAQATSTAWRAGTIKTMNYEQTLGVTQDEMPGALASIQRDMAKRLQNLGSDRAQRAWIPTESGYHAFLGDLSKKRADLMPVAPKVETPARAPDYVPWAKRVPGEGGIGRMYPYVPKTGAQGQPIPPEHRRIMVAGIRRTAATKIYEGLAEQDPLTLNTLGELHRYMRYRLAAEGEPMLQGDQLTNFGLTIGIVESVDDVGAQGRAARLRNPLNLKFLFAVPQIGEAMFALPRNKHDWITPQLEQHFWDLAEDYARGVATAWQTGHIIGHKYGPDFNITAEEAPTAIPARIAQVQRQVAHHRYSLGCEARHWDAERDPYRPFMGDLRRARGVDKAALVDTRQEVMTDLDKAETLSDMLWHVADQHVGRAQMAAWLGIDDSAMNSFFGRFTGQNARGDEATRVLAERAGYNKDILKSLPELPAKLKEALPELFTPYQQARFVCLAEEYAQLALDCYYERGGKAIKRPHDVRELAEDYLEYTAPRQMAELVAAHPAAAARAALATENELLYSLTASEFKRREHRSAEAKPASHVEQLQERSANQRATGLR